MKNIKQIFLFFFRYIREKTILGKIVPQKIMSSIYTFFGMGKIKIQLVIEKISKDYYEIYKNNCFKQVLIFVKKYRFRTIDFFKIWLKSESNSVKYFDFNSAKLPDISNDKAEMKALLGIFLDTFLFFLFFDDNYDKTIIKNFEQLMPEGPYGYVDDDFNVTVNENDVVIDAGAWIGDFSAYAAVKGATVYAFEPVDKTYKILEKTALLNDNKIIPVKKALGNEIGEIEINILKNASSGNNININKSKIKETINIIKLDDFVEKEKIKKIDFMKADIEGAERFLLLGAQKVLKEFAPKLAICTYHLNDDPVLLPKIILDINPEYSIIHTKHKLFAMVKNKK